MDLPFRGCNLHCSKKINGKFIPSRASMPPFPDGARHGQTQRSRCPHAAHRRKFEALPRQLQGVARYVEEQRSRSWSSASTRSPTAAACIPRRWCASPSASVFPVFRKCSRCSATPTPTQVTPARSYQQRIRQGHPERRVGDAGGAGRAAVHRRQPRRAWTSWPARFDAARFKAAVDLLVKAANIYVVAVRRSFSDGHAISPMRCSIPTSACTWSSGLGGMYREQMRSIGKHDVLIAISFPPYGRETLYCSRVAQQHKASVLAITESELGPLAQHAGVLLKVSEGSAFAFRGAHQHHLPVPGAVRRAGLRARTQGRRNVARWRHTMIEVAVFGAGRIGTHPRRQSRAPPRRAPALRGRRACAGRAGAGRTERREGRRASRRRWPIRRSAPWSSVPAPTRIAELIQRAAAAGKAIFCEKPVDLDVERARACAAAVEKAGVACMIGFQRRFDPTFSALKQRLDAGEIGAPELLVVTSRDPGAPPASYIAQLRRHLQGHADPRLRHLSLDPRRRSRERACHGRLPDRSGDRSGRRYRHDRSNAPHEAAASCARSTRRAAPPTATTSASKCWAARACCRQATWRRPRSVAYGQEHRPATCPSISSWSATVRPMRPRSPTSLDALAGATPVRTTIADGIKSLQLAEAAARSWREGQAVAVNI